MGPYGTVQDHMNHMEPYRPKWDIFLSNFKLCLDLAKSPSVCFFVCLFVNFQFIELLTQVKMHYINTDQVYNIFCFV